MKNPFAKKPAVVEPAVVEPTIPEYVPETSVTTLFRGAIAAGHQAGTYKVAELQDAMIADLTTKIAEVMSANQGDTGSAATMAESIFASAVTDPGVVANFQKQGESADIDAALEAVAEVLGPRLAPYVAKYMVQQAS